jgi:hypothetical protein
MSVFNQQRRTLLSQANWQDPLAVFDQDLLSLIDSKLLQPHHLVFLMDANCPPTSSSPFIQQLSKRLYNIHSTRHTGTAPPTYQRGSHPIDGIWVSPTLLSSQCGYLPFGDGLISDHRPLWIDIPSALLFGTQPPPTSPMSSRRLTLMDPRVVARYIHLCETKLNAAGLQPRLDALLDSAGVLTPLQAKEWESLDALWVSIMKEAEAKCRKFRCGAVPWSPEISQALHSIAYWRLSLKKLQGHAIHAKTITRAAKRAGIQPNPLDITQTFIRLQHALNHYRRLKKQAPQRRHDFLFSIAVARSVSA